MRSTPRFLGLLLSAFVVLASPVPDVRASADLPDYVIAEFGKPPAVPDGPLPADLQAAIRTAFVESATRSQWGAEQSAALEQIKARNDPRIAWRSAT